MSEEPLIEPLADPTPTTTAQGTQTQRAPVLPITPRLPGMPVQQGSQPQPSTASPNNTAAAAPANTPVTPTAPTADTPAEPTDTTQTNSATTPLEDGHSPDDGHGHGPHEAATTNDAPSSTEQGHAGETEPAEQIPADSSPIDPSQAIDMVTGLAEPLLSLPASLFGLGSGLLAPFQQILNQFGQGQPAMPTSNGFPQDVLNRLSGTDATTGMTGQSSDAYQADVDKQASQARALDNLEAKLRAALENSAANSTMGRDQIEQIINQVSSTLQALGPIANTPMGQLGVITAISQALQQAGAVLTDAVGKDSLNASTVESMALDYIKDANTPANDEDRQRYLANGGVEAWIVQGLAANGITDPRAIANWMPGLKLMAQRESGNNPAAVNNVDINAQNGTPSIGIMQIIKPTFDAHWRPGTEYSQYNPVSSFAAAVHYMMDRYNVAADGSNLTANVQQANPYASPRGY